MKPAFSAVELLLVAGISAILVAIAVPNYMEAKVRAEVVDTSLTLRNVRIGLYQYKLDFGQYPSKKDASNPLSVHPMYKLYELYNDSVMTKFPEDRFKKGLQGHGGYYDEPLLDYGFLELNSIYEPLRARLKENSQVRINDNQNRGPWVLRSIGPDQTDFRDEMGGRGSNRQNPASVVEYDPTNGVFSLGEIITLETGS